MGVRLHHSSYSFATVPPKHNEALEYEREREEIILSFILHCIFETHVLIHLSNTTTAVEVFYKHWTLHWIDKLLSSLVILPVPIYCKSLNWGSIAASDLGRFLTHLIPLHFDCAWSKQPRRRTVCRTSRNVQLWNITVKKLRTDALLRIANSQTGVSVRIVCHHYESLSSNASRQ